MSWEYWVFNMKEIRFIAELMLDELLSLPDNSELSIMDLFEKTLRAERIKENEEMMGYKIKDINLPNGKHLHDYINWNYENGLWDPYVKQGFALTDAFYKKAKRKGYIIDSSRTAGGHVGLPFCVTRVFRFKKNLINSFKNPDKTTTIHHGVNSYTLQTIFETNQWQGRDYRTKMLVKYEEKKVLQLLTLPAGNCTGKIFHKKGNICLYILRGKCKYCGSYWDYGAIYPKRKAQWNEMKGQTILRWNQSIYSSANRHTSDKEAPSDAWYQITNIGKTDLLVFIADPSLTKNTEIK